MAFACQDEVVLSFKGMKEEKRRNGNLISHMEAILRVCFLLLLLGGALTFLFVIIGQVSMGSFPRFLCLLIIHILASGFIHVEGPRSGMFMLDGTFELLDKGLVIFLQGVAGQIANGYDKLTFVTYVVLYEVSWDWIAMGLYNVVKVEWDLSSTFGLIYVLVTICCVKGYMWAVVSKCSQEMAFMINEGKMEINPPSKGKDEIPPHVTNTTSPARQAERKQQKKQQQKKTWSQRLYEKAIHNAKIKEEKNKDRVAKAPKTETTHYHNNEEQKEKKEVKKPPHFYVPEPYEPNVYDRVHSSGFGKSNWSYEGKRIVEHQPNLVRATEKWLGVVGWKSKSIVDFDDPSVLSGVEELLPRFVNASHWPIQQTNNGILVNDGITSFVIPPPRKASAVGIYFEVEGKLQSSDLTPVYVHKLSVHPWELADKGVVFLSESDGPQGIYFFEGPFGAKAWIPKVAVRDLSLFLSRSSVEWIESSFNQIGFSWGLNQEQSQALRCFVINQFQSLQQSVLPDWDLSKNKLYAILATLIVVFFTFLSVFPWLPFWLQIFFSLWNYPMISMIAHINHSMTGINMKHFHNFKGLLLAAFYEELAKRIGGVGTILAVVCWESKVGRDGVAMMLHRFLVHVSLSVIPIYLAVPLHAYINWLVYSGKGGYMLKNWSFVLPNWRSFTLKPKFSLHSKFALSLERRVVDHMERAYRFARRGLNSIPLIVEYPKWFKKEFCFYYETEQLLNQGYITPLYDIDKPYFIQRVKHHQPIRRLTRVITIVASVLGLDFTAKPTSQANIMEVTIKRLMEKLPYNVPKTLLYIKLFNDFWWKFFVDTFPCPEEDGFDLPIPTLLTPSKYVNRHTRQVSFHYKNFESLYSYYMEHLKGNKLKDAQNYKQQISIFFNKYGTTIQGLDHIKRLGLHKVKLMTKADELTYDSKKGRQIFMFDPFMVHLIGFMLYNMTKVFKFSLRSDLIYGFYFADPYKLSQRDEFLRELNPLRIMPQLNFVLESTPVKLAFIFTHLVIVSFKYKNNVSIATDDKIILSQWRDLKLFMFDISNADRSSNTRWMENSLLILQDICGKNSFLFHLIMTLTSELHVTTRDGIAMVIMQMLTTGAPWTSIMNSLNIISQAVGVLRDMNVWDENFILNQTGDDSIGVSTRMYDTDMSWVTSFTSKLLEVGVKCECQVANLAQVDYIGCKMVPAYHKGRILYVPIPMRFLKVGCFHTLDVRESTLPIVHSVFDYWLRVTRIDPLSHAWVSFCKSRLPDCSTRGVVTMADLGKTNPGFDWTNSEVMDFYDSLETHPAALDFSLSRYGGEMYELMDCIHWLLTFDSTRTACVVDHPYLRRVVSKEFPL